MDAHGYYIEHGNNIDLKNKDWSSDYTKKEILVTSGNAVVLVRNPFEAIYAYRHLTYESHAGQITAYNFFGKGIASSSTGYKIDKNVTRGLFI